MNEHTKKRALEFHALSHGKIQISGTVPFETPEDLGMVYTPGMGYPCMEIAHNPDDVYKYTWKGRTVAVVTNGTAVLGFGSIGPFAALPVMEGKSYVFKKFANIDAVPICLDTTDPDEIISVCEKIAPGFGGIHLEDIKAPECFYIEDTLKEKLDIPVFHDDQHGTAIVALAGLINALKVVDKEFADLKVAINGAGAAGIAIAKIINSRGARDIVLCDSKGIIHQNRDDLNVYKKDTLKFANKDGITGSLADAMKDADVFLGVSKAGLVTKAMVSSMADSPIVFAMANPVPEISPEEAYKGGAAVVATGRADYPNQVNNVLAFPGLFKGVLDARARNITDNMKIAAAEGLAALISDPSPDLIIPGAFDEGVVEAVAASVFASH